MQQLQSVFEIGDVKMKTHSEFIVSFKRQTPFPDIHRGEDLRKQIKILKTVKFLYLYLPGLIQSFWKARKLCFGNII